VISASVRIAAPPEVVFAYFTGPQLFVTWTGQRADLDARPGGTFAFDFEVPPPRGSYVNLTHRDLPPDREPSHREGWEGCLAALAAAVRQ